MRARRLLYVGLLATVAVYWTGLHGPFLLDDFFNLAPVLQWQQGNGSWQYAIFGNDSGLLGRSVSMATFVLNASLGGASAFSFKLGNLVLHLACGVLAWQLLRRMLAMDRNLAMHAEPLAAGVALVWLLHPVHVSTVLYVVQRMSQMSSLWVLASLLVYVFARRQLIEGGTWRAKLTLFALFPLLLAAGLLSKENAAVAPALCLVLELAYFGSHGRPRPIIAFFGVFLLLPLSGLLCVLLLDPDRLLAIYATRDFTMAERLLSQSRALLDYVHQLLLPHGPRMGLYSDDFPVSTGLLSPPSTLWSLLALTAISGLAIAIRKRAPSAFAGWFMFLGAHAVESSFLPLELYFEHRNYLPAIFLLLAVVGAGSLVPNVAAVRSSRLSRIFILAILGLGTVLAFATFSRAGVWQSQEAIVEQGLKYHPDSLRANLDKAALTQKAGRYDEYMEVMKNLQHSDNPRHRLLGYLYTVSINCVRGADPAPSGLAMVEREAGPRVTLAEHYAYKVLANASAKHDCGSVTDADIADSIDGVLSAAALQPDPSQPKWLLRTTAAELYVRAGLWEKAQVQAELAWQPTADAGVGSLLVVIYAHNQMWELARQTLGQVEKRMEPFDYEGKYRLSQLRHSLEQLQSRRNTGSRQNPVNE